MSAPSAQEARPHEPTGERRRQVLIFTRLMRVLAAVPLLAGLLHVSFGVAANLQLGALLEPAVLRDPVLDSQDRFQGVVFMGYGVLFYLGLADLKRNAAVFRIAGAFIALGGVARLLSIALRGLPPAPVLVLVGMEVLLMPLILWWHARVLARL
jgi:hypothetical protein